MCVGGVCVWGVYVGCMGCVWGAYVCMGWMCVGGICVYGVDMYGVYVCMGCMWIPLPTRLSRDIHTLYFKSDIHYGCLSVIDDNTRPSCQCLERKLPGMFSSMLTAYE